MHRIRTAALPGAARRRLWAVAAAGAIALAACSPRDTPESLFEEAKTHSAKGDRAAALVLLKAAVRSDPEFAEARFMLGKTLFETGDPRGAAVELLKLLEQPFDRDQVLPELARALLWSGQAPLLTGNYGSENLTAKEAQASFKTTVATAWSVLGDRAQSEAALNAALAAVPGHPQALVLRARGLAGGGDLDGAMRIVEQVLERDSKRPEALLLKGEILAFGRNDAQRALAAFRDALAVDPNNVAAHAAIVNLHLRAGDMAAARKQADALREAVPAHPQTLFTDAFLLASSKEFVPAREKIQAVLRVLPDHTSVLQLAGAIEAQLGSLTVAQSHFAKALSLNPSLVHARRAVARTHIQLGKPANALETLKPLIEPDSVDAEALAIAGEAALALGDARSAEQLFGRASRLDARNPRVQTAAAVARLARDDSAEAFGTLRTLAAANEESYADLALVSAHLKRGEYDAALQAVDVLARKQPKSAQPHELRGRVLAAKGDLPAARAAFEQAARVDPKTFTPLASLNELDLRERRFDAARQRTERAIEDQPDSLPAHTELARILERSGAPLEETRRVLAEAVRLAPTDAGTRVLLVDTLLRARQAKEAVTAAQGADAAIPNNVEVLDALGRAQALAGETQQALATFRRISNLDALSPRPHVRLASLYRDQGRNAEAIASLRRALELDPTHEQARSDLVDLLVRGNQAKQAIDLARELQAASPELAAGYLLEGAVRVRTKDLPGAIAVYRAGLQKARDPAEIARQLYRALRDADRQSEAESFAAAWIREHPDDAGMHFEVSGAAVERRDLAAAEKHLRLAVAGRPDHPMALNNLAWVLVARGKPGALPLARRAVELLPDHASLLDTLATVLASEKQYAEALRTQRRAVELAPGNAGMRLNLARIAIEAGDKTLARGELEHVLSLGSRTRFQAEANRLLKAL